MAEQKVGIVTECGCDLPKSYLTEHGIDILYFLIETDSGVFTDTQEITSENILSYMQNGGIRSHSAPPHIQAYREAFEDKLHRFDEVIHIAISSGISESIVCAEKALEEMGEDAARIHLFDSKHLSAGIGLLVMKAVEMAEAGSSAAEIISVLESMRDNISTTFLTETVDYLARNGRVSEKVKKTCDAFNAHPVMVMRDGKIALKYVLFGNYEKACMRYVRRELKKAERTVRGPVFIANSGCGVKRMEKIKGEAQKKCGAKEVTVTKASATISSSCGPNTFGIMFVREG